ncbi:MAG: CapA family protein [Candidatus Methanoperedens sp.]|nr:CapA family protein [Candidatus Methanoperedens sp.]
MNIDGERDLVLAFNGDVMLGRLVNEMIRHMGASYVWGDTLPLIKKADLRLVNLECVIAKDGIPWDKTPKVFFFRADPHAIDVLKIAEVNYVSLANNHTLGTEYAIKAHKYLQGVCACCDRDGCGYLPWPQLPYLSGN